MSRALQFTAAVALSSLALFPAAVLARDPQPYEGKFSGFKAEIAKALEHPCLKSKNFGVKFYSLDTHEALFQIRNDRQFIPASNVKLITSAVALRTLGPDYRFVTKLYSSRKPDNGVLYGDLYIKGSGDPKLVTEQMWILANDLRNHPLHSIEGNVIADDSYFDNVRRVKTWDGDFGPEAYNAPLGALSFNFNTIKLLLSPGLGIGAKPVVVVDPDTEYTLVANEATTLADDKKGHLTVTRMGVEGKTKIVLSGGIRKNSGRSKHYLNITDPTMFTATVLKHYLAKAGVKVKGAVKSGVLPESAQILAQHDSEPLSAALTGLNKFSNNFVAEQILKTIGAEKTGAPGTTENGAKVVSDYLQSLGLENFHLVDGSGLSRENRVSPDQIVRVLEHVQQDWSIFPEYLASLAVMGQDGSVKERLTHVPEARRVRVKTGTLDGVSALSGYVQSKSGELLAFSMLMNDVQCAHGEATALQDKIVQEAINFDRP